MEWVTIIGGLLLPMLAKCWNKTSVEDPQTVLKANYDPSTGKMDSDIVNDAIPATRRAVRKARKNADPSDRREFPRYTRHELYYIAEKNLIDAMNAPPEKVEQVMAAAAALPDEDDE
jgi:hypothetical protein